MRQKDFCYSMSQKAIFMEKQNTRRIFMWNRNYMLNAESSDRKQIEKQLIQK